MQFLCHATMHLRFVLFPLPNLSPASSQVPPWLSSFIKVRDTAVLCSAPPSSVDPTLHLLQQPSQRRRRFKKRETQGTVRPHNHPRGITWPTPNRIKTCKFSDNFDNECIRKGGGQEGNWVEDARSAICSTYTELPVCLLSSSSLALSSQQTLYVGRVPVASFVRDVYIIEYAMQFFHPPSILLLTCTREDEITIMRFIPPSVQCHVIHLWLIRIA